MLPTSSKRGSRLYKNLNKLWNNLGLPLLVKPQQNAAMRQYSSGPEYDSSFRSKVDLTRICVKISENAPPSPTHVADSVEETMKTISLDYPVIKWQYFASEQGVLANFPAFEDKESCRSYDPRFRPFYVETATPEPKDVVLVIDHSGSMRGERIRVVRETVKTVLRTMNPRDRVCMALGTGISNLSPVAGSSSKLIQNLR